MATTAPPLRILLVEDNLPDIRLTTEALKDGGTSSTLAVARDGVEALLMLQHDTASTRPALPDLILLDLNLPRRDGREVLRAVKSDPDLVHIPIIILTTSAAEQDVRDSYRLGANAYVVKPVDLDRFFAVVAAIQQFWMHAARLASGPGRLT
jgi:chemotaxis family two-component system response regulator Rcp1